MLMWCRRALGVVAVGFLLYYPYAKDDDGKVRRLINVQTRGFRNTTLVAGGDSPVAGNIQSTGRGSVTVNHGLTVEQLGGSKST
jgi:hypothetical protein